MMKSPLPQRWLVLMSLVCLLVLGCGEKTASAQPTSQSGDNTPTPALATTATGQPMPTVRPGTPTAKANPYPPFTGTLIMNDPMHDNSQGNAWDEVKQGTMICEFAGGAYHVMTGASQAFICAPEAPKLTLKDFTFQINLQAVQGDTIGIAFRLNQTTNAFYLFSLDVQRGAFVLSAFNGANPSVLITTNVNSVIKKGLGQTNTLAVVANGAKISLYVNMKLVSQGYDDKYSSGQLGIFASSSHGPADVMASNALVWQQ